jgi:pilus assembly protein CpaE
MMTDEKVVLQGSRRSEQRIGVLCIGMDSSSRESLDVLVVQTPGAYVVDNVDWHITPREAMKMLEPYQHRICVIDFEDGTEKGCRVAQRLRDGCDSSLGIFAAAGGSDPEQIMAAMRSGCSEYLVKPFQPERISHALAHVAARPQGKSGDLVKGRIVTVMGAKGGTGATSLALHLALNLVQRHGQKCLLVDEHLAFGDASLYLGLGRHQYSFYELVHNTDRLDADLLRGFLLRHPSGLDVLDSPEAIDGFPQPSPEAIEHTLSFLGENYQFVIIDCPPGLTEESCAAIRQSDRLAIVITPELPAIRNAIRSIEYLTSMHYSADSIDIVLNRHSKKSALSDHEVEAALHRPIAVKIPNNYGEIVNAINAGTPIEFGHRSELPAAFDYWADRLTGSEGDIPRANKGSRGWFGIFGSRVEG